MAPMTQSPCLSQSPTTIPIFIVAGNMNGTNTSSYNQAAAYLAGRIMTFSGVSLLLLGLCCACILLLRFNRGHRNPRVQRVEGEKAHVLDQEAINQFFPVRIWPSEQRFIIDSKNRMIAVSELSKELKLDSTIGRIGVEDHNAFKEQRFGQWSLYKKLWFYNRNQSSSSNCDRSVGNSGSSNNNICLNPPMATTVSLSLDIHSIESYNARTSPIEVSCSICLCDYMADDRVRTLSCNHEYHAECIDIWLTSKSTQCPLCKHDLFGDVEMPSTRMSVSSSHSSSPCLR